MRLKRWCLVKMKNKMGGEVKAEFVKDRAYLFFFFFFFSLLSTLKQFGRGRTVNVGGFKGEKEERTVSKWHFPTTFLLILSFASFIKKKYKTKQDKTNYRSYTRYKML